MYHFSVVKFVPHFPLQTFKHCGWLPLYIYILLYMCWNIFYYFICHKNIYIAVVCSLTLMKILLLKQIFLSIYLFSFFFSVEKYFACQIMCIYVCAVYLYKIKHFTKLFYVQYICCIQVLSTTNILIVQEKKNCRTSQTKRHCVLYNNTIIIV